MRRSLRGWLSLRKKRKKVHRPLALLTYPRHLACQSQCQKEEPWSLWDGRRCCTHSDQWWPPEIYLDQPGPKVKGGSETDPSDDIHEAASLPSKDPYSTSALTIYACFGTHMTADPTPRLCWSNHLFMCSWTGRSGSWTANGSHAHGTGGSPGIASMSSSHIVKGELMGVTYMDTVTTSVGRVTISSLGLEAFSTSPTIEDITDSH